MKRIASEVGVSLSTVSLWVRDIILTDDQKRRNRLRGAEKRSAAWSERHRDRRRAYQAQGRAHARTGDALHQAGCMLYWAEGSKERNALIFANGDPAMITLYARFLRESLGVESERMTVRLNFYTGNGLTQADIETHWLNLLDLERSALRSPTINHFPTSSSGRRRNKLTYGVCTLKVHSTELAQHVYGAIQEYSGVDNPAWLG